MYWITVWDPDLQALLLFHALFSGVSYDLLHLLRLDYYIFDYSQLLVLGNTFQRWYSK